MNLHSWIKGEAVWTSRNPVQFYATHCKWIVMRANVCKKCFSGGFRSCLKMATKWRWIVPERRCYQTFLTTIRKLKGRYLLIDCFYCLKMKYFSMWAADHHLSDIKNISVLILVMSSVNTGLVRSPVDILLLLPFFQLFFIILLLQLLLMKPLLWLYMGMLWRWLLKVLQGIWLLEIILRLSLLSELIMLLCSAFSQSAHSFPHCCPFFLFAVLVSNFVAHDRYELPHFYEHFLNVSLFGTKYILSNGCTKISRKMLVVQTYYNCKINTKNRKNYENTF